MLNVLAGATRSIDPARARESRSSDLLDSMIACCRLAEFFIPYFIWLRRPLCAKFHRVRDSSTIQRKKSMPSQHIVIFFRAEIGEKKKCVPTATATATSKTNSQYAQNLGRRGSLHGVGDRARAPRPTGTTQQRERIRRLFVK